MNKRLNGKNGITLIALVVTIIILLILAGISISALTDNGLFEKVKEAKRKTEEAQEKENSILNEIETIINVYANSEKWNGTVNTPELMTGMTPIKFTEPTSEQEGTTVLTTVSDGNWYNYDDKKWANAQTEDGSMWVWIPRYAYRINSETQTCDIVFLIGTTDNYYDENRNIQTAKRQKTVDEIVDTTTGYTVHPAFTDESSITYANGGWDKELTGIWVAKFEAGYASGNNTAEVKASSVNYTQTLVWVSEAESETGSQCSQNAKNWLDGTYGTKTTSIKYPTFQGLTYSMNYININDSYNIAKVLTENGNIYGLSSSSTDSHLMKNCEWGAVAYLSQSKYGLNGTNIYINNVSLNNTTTSVYAVTGCAGLNADAEEVDTIIENINNRSDFNIYVWTQANGTKASTTGNIYGIYDMSGGVVEGTSGLIANKSSSLTIYGSSLLNNGISTKYVTVYSYDLNEDISVSNYEKNIQIYGDGIRETSVSGIGTTSWYLDSSKFPMLSETFIFRGGAYRRKDESGLFFFGCNNGSASFGCGFRAVLVSI